MDPRSPSATWAPLRLLVLTILVPTTVGAAFITAVLAVALGGEVPAVPALLTLTATAVCGVAWLGQRWDSTGPGGEEARERDGYPSAVPARTGEAASTAS